MTKKKKNDGEQNSLLASRIGRPEEKRKLGITRRQFGQLVSWISWQRVEAHSVEDKQVIFSIERN